MPGSLLIPIASLIQGMQAPSAVNPLYGKIPGTEVSWAEAIRVGLELRSQRLLLLAEPTIWFLETRTPTTTHASPISSAKNSLNGTIQLGANFLMAGLNCSLARTKQPFFVHLTQPLGGCRIPDSEDNGI